MSTVPIYVDRYKLQYSELIRFQRKEALYFHFRDDSESSKNFMRSMRHAGNLSSMRFFHLIIKYEGVEKIMDFWTD